MRYCARTLNRPVKENMKRLLGKFAQAVIISTIAIVAILNSSVQSSHEIKIKTPIQSVTVVNAD
jgi:hypothetical protein